MNLTGVQSISLYNIWKINKLSWYVPKLFYF